MILPNNKVIFMPKPFGGMVPTISFFKKQGGGRVIKVQFSGEVGPIQQYLELLQVLDYATEKDDVKIYIDTPGGDVHTAQLIVERMTSCRANVTTIASGLVASAGTFIWFHGKNKLVEPWARFMFHSSLHSAAGKSLSIYESSENLVQYMKAVMMTLVQEGILTGAEYDRVFGKKSNVELSARQVRARLRKVLAEGEEPVTEPVEDPVDPVEPEAPVEEGEAPTEPVETDAAIAAVLGLTADDDEGEGEPAPEAPVEAPAEPEEKPAEEPAEPTEAPAEPVEAPVEDPAAEPEEGDVGETVDTLCLW